MRGRQLTVAGILWLTSTRALAHPGHAGGSYSLGHYLTDALHIAEGSWWLLLLVTAVIGVGVRLWRRRYAPTSRSHLPLA